MYLRQIREEEFLSDLGIHSSSLMNSKPNLQTTKKDNNKNEVAENSNESFADKLNSLKKKFK